MGKKVGKLWSHYFSPDGQSAETINLKSARAFLLPFYFLSRIFFLF